MQLKMVYTIFSSHAFKKKIFLKRLSFLFILICLFQFNAYSQCLPNIGFEKGNFGNWVYSFYDQTQIDNFYVNSTTPMSEYIPLVINSFPQLLDPNNNIPRFTPNGSKYSVRIGGDHYLGTNILGRYYNQPLLAWDSGSKGFAPGASRISYTFTVPANRNDFAINFEFAVVFTAGSGLTPGSVDEPRFTVKVYDYEANQYLDCKTIDIRFSNPYINFQESTLWMYQYSLPWIFSTINLSGMAGKKLALEFGQVDGTFEGPSKFQGSCYAYLDVDENCASSPVTGNTYCRGDDSITLRGPTTPGHYTWYNSNFSKVIGKKSNSSVLSISPTPLPGTKLALIFEPTPGFGCIDTIYTTVQYSGDTIDLRLKDTLQACIATGANLTAGSVTNGSSNGLSFSYYSDKYFSNIVTLPTHVQQEGSYYITAANTVGCTVTKPLYVKIIDPFIAVNYNIPVVCDPNTINLTNPSLILVSTKNLSYSYWQDSATTIAVTNPQAISTAGKYYIKGTTSEGCSVTSKVNVSFLPAPDFSVAAVNPVDPPATIDITALVDHTTQIQYSYWRDAQAIIALQKPEAVDSRGNYYIKGTGANGCSVIKPVLIGVTTSLQIANAFSPNNDGINDTWEIPYLQSYPNAIVEIYNRYGQIVFKLTGFYKSWDGKLNGKSLPIGTYYYIIKLNPQANPISGSITILK